MEWWGAGRPRVRTDRPCHLQGEPGASQAGHLYSVVVMAAATRVTLEKGAEALAGVSDLWPEGYTQLRMAVTVARHKIISLLKTLRDFFV